MRRRPLFTFVLGWSLSFLLLVGCCEANEYVSGNGEFDRDGSIIDLSAASSSAVRGDVGIDIAERVVFCTFAYGFFPGGARLPEEEEYEALLCQTRDFFTDYIMQANTLAENQDSVMGVSIHNFEGDYTEGADQPVIVTFEISVIVEDTGEELESDQVLSTFPGLDLASYITNFIWDLPTTNVFYEVNSAAWNAFEKTKTEATISDDALSSDVCLVSEDSGMVQESIQEVEEEEDHTTNNSADGPVAFIDISFAFFDGSEREASTLELANFLYQTRLYYSDLLAQSDLATSVTVRLLNYTYDAIISDYPARVNMALEAFTADQTRIMGLDIAEALIAADGAIYIDSYIHEAEPNGISSFSDVEMYQLFTQPVFEDAIGSALMTSSSDDAAPTQSPLSSPTQPPIPPAPTLSPAAAAAPATADHPTALLQTTFTFYENQAEEPSEREMISFFCQTIDFFVVEIQNRVSIAQDVQMSITNWNYDEDAEDLTILFLIQAFDANQAEVPIIDIMAAISEFNFAHYIQEYVWKTVPEGYTVFYYVNMMTSKTLTVDNPVQPIIAMDVCENQVNPEDDEFIRLTMALQFFEGSLTDEPKQEDVEAAMCQTDAYFTDLFSAYIEDGIELLCEDLEWVYLPDEEFPVEFRFNVIASFANQSIVPRTMLLAAMDDHSKLKKYIQDYLWKSEPYKHNIFYQVDECAQGVEMIERDDVPGVTTASCIDVAPTLVPNDPPTASPAPTRPLESSAHLEAQVSFPEGSQPTEPSEEDVSAFACATARYLQDLIDDAIFSMSQASLLNIAIQVTPVDVDWVFNIEAAEMEPIVVTLAVRVSAVGGAPPSASMVVAAFTAKLDTQVYLEDYIQDVQDGSVFKSASDISATMEEAVIGWEGRIPMIDCVRLAAAPIAIVNSAPTAFTGGLPNGLITSGSFSGPSFTSGGALSGGTFSGGQLNFNTGAVNQESTDQEEETDEEEEEEEPETEPVAEEEEDPETEPEAEPEEQENEEEPEEEPEEAPEEQESETEPEPESQEQETEEEPETEPEEQETEEEPEEQETEEEPEEEPEEEQGEPIVEVDEETEEEPVEETQEEAEEETLTIDSEFVISNTDSYDLDELQEIVSNAYEDYVLQMLAATARRRLSTKLVEGSIVVDTLQEHDDCPEGVNECVLANGHYDLMLEGDEDEESVIASYTEATQTGIDAGAMTEFIEEYDHETSLAVSTFTPPVTVSSDENGYAPSQLDISDILSQEDTEEATGEEETVEIEPEQTVETNINEEKQDTSPDTSAGCMYQEGFVWIVVLSLLGVI